jgi:tRNA G37 N-methylase Trm5
MSLGKTFTNAIVREIGRNYGKAISNSLMGDSHSTPVRMVGGDVSRMRGRTYRNKLDEAIEKFTVKGTVATFNAGINIHTQYFSLVEEVVRTLEQIKSVMLDNSDQVRADKVQEKIGEVLDFAKLVHGSIQVEKFPVVVEDGKLRVAGLLTILGLDRWVLKGLPQEYTFLDSSQEVDYWLHG